MAARYGREAVDRVRGDEANRAGNDKAARKVTKGSGRLPPKNADNIGEEQDRVRPAGPPKANREPAAVYALGDDAHFFLKIRQAFPGAGR